MDYAQTKEIIHATSILSDEDTAFIDANITEIQRNWEKKQMWRTETEMRVSVLNDVKFATRAAKYWQCVREQAVFYEQLVHESFTYRRNELKLEKIQLKLDKCTNDLKRRGLVIDMEEAQYAKLNMQLAAKDRMREIRLWSKLMAECVLADPKMDTENVDTHQLVSYMWRWHHQLRGLDKSKSSVSEVNNLVGQYVSGMKVIIERGGQLPLPMAEDAKNLGYELPQALPQPTVQGITASFDIQVGAD